MNDQHEFWVEDREKKEGNKVLDDKPYHHRPHVSPHKEEDDTTRFQWHDRKGI